jgi:flagella basal body P-ring formation protein FlgA
MKLNNTTSEKLHIGTTEKKITGETIKAFPSIDKIRKVMGVNGWFVKENTNHAKPVIKPTSLFKLIKFINNDGVYNGIANIINKKNNSHLTKEQIKEMLNKPSVPDFQLKSILRFPKNNQSKDVILDLQNAADEINKKNGTKIDAVFLVEVNRLARNEMIADIELKPVMGGNEPINTETVQKIENVADTIDKKSALEGIVIANVEMDEATALDQYGGFFQFVINEQELIGGSRNSEMIGFTTLLLTVAQLLDPKTHENLSQHIRRTTGIVNDVTAIHKELTKQRPNTAKVLNHTSAIVTPRQS